MGTNLTTQNTGTKTRHRPDTAILVDIWRELWNEEKNQAVDIHDISVIIGIRKVKAEQQNSVNTGKVTI